MIDTRTLKARHSLVDVAARYGVTLKRDGREWKGCCPFHAEETPSFTIREGRTAQQFHCFGCGADGDVLRFVQLYEGVPLQEAARRLAGGDPPQRGPETGPAEKRASVDPYEGWTAVVPVPLKAPALEPRKRTPDLFNPKAVEEKQVTRYSAPTAVYPYRDTEGYLVGNVLRVELPGGKKLTPLLMWCRHRDGREGWTHFPMPNPRPIYRLDRVEHHADAQVLVVEGEKCADAAYTVFPELACISWQGGTAAVKYTDWSPLAGRRVVLWPDADRESARGLRPGPEAMHELAAILKRLECDVRWIEPPEDMPDGWDVAEALEKDKWSRDIVREFARKTATPYKKPERQRPPPGSIVRQQLSADSRTADAADGDTDGQTLRQTGNVVHLPNAPERLIRDPSGDYFAELVCDAHGKAKPKLLANFETVARLHPTFRGMFSMNTFELRMYLLRQPPWDHSVNEWKPRPFRDDDISRFAIHLERLGFTPTLSAAQAAIVTVATQNEYDPLLDYLDGLTWDGVPRLYGGTREGEPDGWLVEHAGATPSTYHRAVGMRWMIAAVARAHATAERPAKVDTILVLEGPQSAFKSTMLRELATIPDYRAGRMMSTFSDDLAEIKSKDSMQLLQGSWIVELAEMTALGKDVNGDKQWIAKQVDKFRPPFGKTTTTFPRRCVFGASTNPIGGRGYLKDATGARRFWPVRVGKINLDGIRANRDQLWAEAVELYRKGEQWWLWPEEEAAAAEQQERRYLSDPWEGALTAFAETATGPFTPSQALAGLHLSERDWTSQAEERVTKVLARAGYTLGRDDSGRMTYRRTG